MNTRTLIPEEADSAPAPTDGAEQRASRPDQPVEAGRPVARGSAVRTHALAAASLVALVVGLYWPTAGYGFVNWDDPWYILNNPLIRSWHPSNLFDLATRVAIRNYAPLTLFTYLVEHTLWGEWAGGYHLTNFVLHAVNAVLVYFLISRVTGSRFAGWSTAALFAVHPIQIETVAWVSSRKGVLSATFLLASLIYWLRPNRTPRDEAFGLLYYALSLLAKAVGIVMPAIVLAYDVLVRRISFGQALSRQIIPGILALWLLLVTMSAQTTEIGGVRGHLGWNKARIIAVDAAILWDYAAMLIVPRNLCVMYDPPFQEIGAVTLAALCAWLVVAWGAWHYRHRWPLGALALFAFFALLFPVLNFFPITTLMNDRYLYLPAIPFFALAAAGLERLLMRRPNAATAGVEATANYAPTGSARAAAFGFVTAAVACYAAATHAHLPVWRNALSLWNDAMEQQPQLPVVRIQWAEALHEFGRDDEAVAVLQSTLAETRPDEADRRRIERKIGEWSASPSATDDRASEL